MTDEVTVFMAAVGANSRTATGTDADTLASAIAVAASTSDAAPEAYTGGIRRRGDRRLYINSKQQLQLFKSDHPNASMESLNIDR